MPLAGSIGVLVLILGLFAALLFGTQSFLPAFSVESARPVLQVIILGVATFAGVMSNSIYERIRSSKRPGTSVRRQDVVLAAVVAPVVMLPIYETLQATQNYVIMALTAYQNGFFFNTWFAKLREGS